MHLVAALLQVHGGRRGVSPVQLAVAVEIVVDGHLHALQVDEEGIVVGYRPAGKAREHRLPVDIDAAVEAPEAAAGGRVVELAGREQAGRSVEQLALLGGSSDNGDGEEKGAQKQRA